MKLKTTVFTNFEKTRFTLTGPFFPPTPSNIILYLFKLIIIFKRAIRYK